MKKLLWTFAHRLLALAILTVVGGLLTATLVRYAPGYGVDERELDFRLSATSVEALRSHRAHDNLFGFYGSYLSAASKGDLGTSESLQRPILQLIGERFPVTARSVLFGIVVAWLAAALLAVFGLIFRGWTYEVSTTLLSGFVLALPSAAIALVFVYFRAPVFLAIALVIFPKLFRYVRNLLLHAQSQPHVFAARARGISGPHIFLRHIVPSAAPGLIALLGVSLSLAFGAAVPIEALCDSPGIGHLAWYAALNRDLPLIMSLTLIVTLVTVASNSLAADAARLFAREV